MNLHKMLNKGYGNVVNSKKVVAVVSPDSAAVKRLSQNSMDEGKDENIAKDAAGGGGAKSVIITDSNYIILSALVPDTIAGRFNESIMQGKEDNNEE